jgi:PqqD family protein of HPr-rel-A system
MTNSVRIKDLAISENGFVFDPFSGATFTLNTTGHAIIKGLRDGLSQPEIVAQLSDSFDGVTNKLHEDVQDFIRTLNEFGLLADQ